MAQKVLKMLQDDIDGSEASETVMFGLDGTSYQIDLSTDHATQLRELLSGYVAAGRRVGGRRTRGTGTGAPALTVTETPVDPTAVRAWAAANRVEVSARGRIPTAVVTQFREAGH
ncbi:MAG: Lsr2 family protein [Kineosporiaceae bacterium]